MINRFKELVDSGIAQPKYKNLIKPVSETDEVCRLYNNIFAIITDTHMSMLDDGRRVITGHMINTPNWDKFIYSCNWGAVQFKPSGFWSLSDLLTKYGLRGERGCINNDTVYIITPYVAPSCEELPTCNCTTCCTTESQIPLPLYTISKSFDIKSVKECFNTDIYNAVKNLNKSEDIIGEDWIVVNNNTIAGLCGDKVYILNCN